MSSPAQRHLARHYAQVERNETTMQANSAYEMMLSKLHTDRQRLKLIESIETKISVKKELIPEYLPWINGVLAANSTQQDDVFMRILTWMIDAKQFADAYPLAEHALKHGWSPPDNFKRKTPALVMEELANTALSQLTNKQAVDTETLLKFDLLLADKDIFDQVKAKFKKALGFALKEQDPNSALNYLRRALELDDTCGVKTTIKELEKALKNEENADS